MERNPVAEPLDPKELTDLRELVMSLVWSEEAMRPSLEPEVRPKPPNRVVDTLPGQPPSLRGPVEIQEEGPRFIPTDGKPFP